MSDDFSRAQLLRQHRRYEEAVVLLQRQLPHFPDNPDLYIELALNRSEIPGAMKLALEDAKTATGLLPDQSFPLALQAQILTQLDREKEALPLAESAVSLDPQSVYGWNTRAIVLSALRRWKEAEECARESLALDPDDETASNLLAHVLRLQNRLDDSEEENRRRLARDPENAFSFANAGWGALQRGRISEAEGFFKESLRLDPDLNHAREGLKEAYRARSKFYRLFLRWAFFMQRFSEGNRFLMVLGILFGFKILRWAAEMIHPVLVGVLVVVYFVFLFGTWLASGLANFVLLRDPVARLSLDRGEKAEGLAVGLLFFGGLVSLATGFSLGMNPLTFGGGALMVASLPATMVFTNPSKLGQVVFGLAAIGVILLGGVAVVDLLRNPDRFVMEGAAGLAISMAAIIALGTTWLAMIPALRKARRA
jgi:tetratricopeptide (TPR) repeat protein